MKHLSRKFSTAGIVLVLACGAAGVTSAQPLPATDTNPPPSIAGHRTKAIEIAGNHPFASLLATEGYWCMAPTEGRNDVFALSTANYDVAPEKIFDNLYYVGKPFVGTYILKTSAGLVLWDTLDNEDEAKTMLVPGMQKLGLDPKDIKLVILTHGHFDHFGGAKYLQDTYHTTIALSEADWKMIESTPLTEGSMHGVTPPKRDRVLADGEDVKVGDATIHIVLTPGHSPGTVSSIFTVKDHGKPRVMAMWGGTAYPAARSALDQMGLSMAKFKTAITDAKAVGLLNTHPRAFYIRERLADRDPKAINPLVLGADDVQASFGVMSECLASMQDWYTAQGKN